MPECCFSIDVRAVRIFDIGPIKGYGQICRVKTLADLVEIICGSMYDE